MAIEIHFLIPYVEAELKKKNISLDLSKGVQELGAGRYSKTYLVESSDGKLVIHLVGSHNPDIQFKQAEKRFEISQFLKKHPKVPTAEMITYGEVEGTVFTVQEYIAGKIWAEKKANLKHLQHLAKILAYLHQINLKGSGYLQFKEGKPEGTHEDWYLFLKPWVMSSLKNIYEYVQIKKLTDSISEKKYLYLKNKLELFFEKYKDYFMGVKGKLLHGDLALGNIILGGKKVNALIDLDFSCSGDPAWEFALRDHLHEKCLDYYFAELKKIGLELDEDQFRFRIKLYVPLLRIIITNSLKSGRHKNIKKDLYIFEKMIDELL